MEWFRVSRARSSGRFSADVWAWVGVEVGPGGLHAASAASLEWKELAAVSGLGGV